MNRLHEFVEINTKICPDELALIDFDGTRLDWKAVAEAVKAAADELVSAGVAPGDRVLMVSENCVAAIAFIHACSRLDATVIPVNARLSQRELDQIEVHAKPVVAIYTTAASEAAAVHASVAGGRSIEGIFGEVAISEMERVAPMPVSIDATEQVACLLYTTGTTGAPKAVMLTHANVIFAARNSADIRGMETADQVVGVLPITHVFGLCSMMLAACYCRAIIRLENRFSVERLLDALMDGVTFFPGVPQMHSKLFQYAHSMGMTSLTGSKLKIVSSGGAPLDPTWKKGAETFYGVALQNGYGMTETSGPITIAVHEIGNPDVSCGTPVAHTEVRLGEVDANAGDGSGEILVRGPQVMKGYYLAPELTDENFTEDGFLRTGDLGRFDEEGQLHVIGRSKELIIRSGFNVYPQEIEAVLNEHASIAMAAVVGRKTHGDEEVLAFVQLRAGESATEEELKQYSGELLTGYKRPSRIVVTKALPVTTTGKIQKAKLIEAFQHELQEGR